MSEFFVIPSLRKVAFKHLRASFNFAPELDGVPSEYAAALIDNEMLNPVALMKNVFMPAMVSFIADAYQSFSSASFEERVRSGKVVIAYSAPGDSVHDSFHSYVSGGAEISLRAFFLDSTPTKMFPDIPLTAYMLAEVENTKETYADYAEKMLSSLTEGVRESTKGKNYGFSPSYYHDNLIYTQRKLARVVTLAALCQATEYAYEEEDLVSQFDSVLDYHCRHLKAYQDSKLSVVEGG